MKLFFRFFALMLVSFALTACDDWFSDSSQAPNVSFQDLQGTQHELKDYLGKVVLLKVWTTDCTTCVAQMPDNIAYQNEYGPQSFDVIAMALKHNPIAYVRNLTQNSQIAHTSARE